MDQTEKMIDLPISDILKKSPGDIKDVFGICHPGKMEYVTEEYPRVHYKGNGPDRKNRNTRSIFREKGQICGTI